MSELELKTLLATLGLPVYYHHFVSTPQQPTVQHPFILYASETTDTKKADDMVFFESNEYIVDLITETKNTTLETQLETLFKNNHIPYDKEFDYLNDEKVYQARYFI